MQTSLKKALKNILNPFLVILSLIGIDPRRVLNLRNAPRFISEYLKYQRLGGKITHRFPILFDYHDQAGSASGHYFHQDLLVASFINKANPIRHIDIGSRIDGFVAHVASFRKIEVMDIRELQSTSHANISFINADLMDKNNANKNCADSISCLHAIEHFGLGRYGDPLDPYGHIKGFNNILQMLKIDGTFYISFPIGKANETHFNAHRVFHPHDIFTWLDQQNRIELLRFDYVDDAGELHQNIDLHTAGQNVSYGCGIYTFKKLSN